MPQNKPFSLQEDNVIVFLYDNLKIKKWALVAKKMKQDYGLERNAKQCRDRYQQFLDPLSSSQWTPQEEKQLYYLHSSIGNKWALIASYFPGKTDNYLKNHFYSKLRKALRHLNKIIKSHLRKEFKQIKIATIYKIIEGFQEQFKEKPYVTKQVSLECCTLKDSLIQFAGEPNEFSGENQDCNFIKEKVLIEKIVEFSKTYRKKSKKQKRDSLQIEELFKPAKRIDLMMNIKQQGEDSQFEKVSQMDSSDEENQNQMHSEGSGMNNYDSEKDELRKSPPIYVIYKDDENQSPNSNKSGIDVRLSDPHSQIKMQEEDNRKNRFEETEGQKTCGFFFMKGDSCFKSYKSQSDKSMYSRTDAYGQIRISGHTGQHEMQNERQPNLFRSHK